MLNVPSQADKLNIFLDTNIYIIGHLQPDSFEHKILQGLSQAHNFATSVKVVVSQQSLDEVSRVARRLRHKDWSGELLAYIWRSFPIHYVIFDEMVFDRESLANIIPREDINVYLTAKLGQANIFISSNRKLIRALVEETHDFKCLSPDVFVHQYLS